MTFPTEQDRLFFASEEAKRIQELWEPKPGDWFAYPKVGWKVAIVKGRDFAKRRRRAEQIWLPRQGQLQEMLEERGYEWEVASPRMDITRYTVAIWLAKQYPYASRTIFTRGPTPAIALGRALIEVMSKEGEK